jgi:hypothetical protein
MHTVLSVQQIWPFKTSCHSLPSFYAWNGPQWLQVSKNKIPATRMSFPAQPWKFLKNCWAPLHGIPKSQFQQYFHQRQKCWMHHTDSDGNYCKVKTATRNKGEYLFHYQLNLGMFRYAIILATPIKDYCFLKVTSCMVQIQQYFRETH